LIVSDAAVRIVQTTFGVFHHFELARELERRGCLQTIYSSYPWARLRREGLPRARVETYPWLHVAQHLADRLPVGRRWLTDELGYANALAFDRWTLKQLQRAARPDALVGLAGSSLDTGRWLQAEGGVFVCDRGSTHQRFQEQVVREEFLRWGVDEPVSDLRDTLREEAIYEASDAVTVPSKSAANSYIKMGVAAKKIYVIPYGVRLEAFSPQPVDSHDFNVLFAGAVGLRKGLPYLLEAFAALRHPRKRLRVIGQMQAEMRGVLGRLPKDGVEFLGSLPRAEVAEWMQRSQVLVLPSVEDGFGLVMAEAMASGCPVIASDQTGAADLFTDGVEGYIVPARDAAAIAERLERLAGDSLLQQTMAAAAVARVRSVGGWTEYGARWERLLRELTGTPPSPTDVA
jgi:glycosyltransferase involved in cell wall biosynthesis